ncbi:MAG: hypothetical protein FJY88_03480 [Candidatus Eisenbacteria bacterium]|nr:hypothetical protein [Candidatus Eisenbacteria bacterium]
MTNANRYRRILLLAALIALPPAELRSATLDVIVVDARDRAPLAGAFVMVGPGKGIPFAGNTGFTSAGGSILFQDPRLVGSQTVTAGLDGYAFTSVIESAQNSITLPLYPSTADTTIYGPVARVTGNVNNIATAFDGKLDLAFVLPAAPLDALIGSGNLLYDAPPDPVSLPGIGDVVFPGNLVMPFQIDFPLAQKPLYKIDLPAQTTQTLYSVAFRIPLEVLIGAPPDTGLIKWAEIRELGVERNVAIGSGRTQHINSDINLLTQLTVDFLGAPLGTQVLAASVGGIPGPTGEERIIGYDTDFALIDTLDAFVLASSTPGGDIADASNFVVGFYADTSRYQAFTSGRVDRTPFTLPATRILRDFYDPPILTQQGARFTWNNVATPGTEPNPTWALSSITLGPTAPPDANVDTTLVWRIVSPAGSRAFALPSLPLEAPGPPSGLPDPEATPEADRLVWELFVANPAGTIDEVLQQPSAGVTHFSRRAQTLNLDPAAAPEAPQPQSAILAYPNPSRGAVCLVMDGSRIAENGRLDVVDLQGRRVRSLGAVASGGVLVWDGRDDSGARVAPGVYFLRPYGEPRRAAKLLMLR